ncbi:MAG: helix-turn-helix transcriptional regulator [Alphaproteobacteria bacterium]|nr:helix-turn-helix transcriptional regulator [Alphaproteobacteria bacterium]
MKYDLLHIQGKPYVLVPLHDYRELTDSEEDTNLPPDVLDKLAAKQESPVKIIRKFRGMTQADLAKASGISRPYLTEIETGKKDGSVRALKALAEALHVGVGQLT